MRVTKVILIDSAIKERNGSVASVCFLSATADYNLLKQEMPVQRSSGPFSASLHIRIFLLSQVSGIKSLRLIESKHGRRKVHCCTTLSPGI